MQTRICNSFSANGMAIHVKISLKELSFIMKYMVVYDHKIDYGKRYHFDISMNPT